MKTTVSTEATIEIPYEGAHLSLTTSYGDETGNRYVLRISATADMSQLAQNAVLERIKQLNDLTTTAFVKAMGLE